MTTITFTPATFDTATFNTATFDTARRVVRSADRRARLRITARGRAVLLALVAAPLVAVLLMLALNGGGATATLDAGAPAQVVMIEPGQSLWSLAESIAPGADPRDVIEELVAFNRLGSADVWAGQQIAIPQQYTR